MNNVSDGRQGSALTRDLVFSLYLPAVVLSLGTGIVAPNLPIFARSFDVSFSTAAMVLVVHAWGGIASALPTGYLLDRIGRRPVMLMGPFLTAITALMTAFAPTFFWLLAFRFISGFAGQMWFQGRLAMIADTGRARDRGKLITWLPAPSASACSLSRPSSAASSASGTSKQSFILHGMLVLIVLVPLFVRRRSPGPPSLPTARPSMSPLGATSSPRCAGRACSSSCSPSSSPTSPAAASAASSASTSPSPSTKAPVRWA
jgi:MFS family permease